MVSITIHDNADRLRLQVEGHLEGPGICELEWCWRTASSTLGDRKLVVELQRATALDSQATVLLESLRTQGAEIISKPTVADGSARRLRKTLLALFERALFERAGQARSQPARTAVSSLS